VKYIVSKVYNDAQNLLKKMIQDKTLKAHGVVAFYRANSVGDDIEVYDDNGQVLTVLRGLRQQVKIH
jgi:5-methyltetrahydrofolate--homocysteine methyltransferase